MKDREYLERDGIKVKIIGEVYTGVINVSQKVFGLRVSVGKRFFDIEKKLYSNESEAIELACYRYIEEGRRFINNKSK